MSWISQVPEQFLDTIVAHAGGPSKARVVAARDDKIVLSERENSALLEAAIARGLVFTPETIAAAHAASKGIPHPTARYQGPRGDSLGNDLGPVT